MKNTTRTSLAIGLCAVLTISLIPQAAFAQYMGKGAGVGALLGLALGDGYLLEDMAAGAALGAAGGGIANMATGGKKRQRQREADRIRAEEAYRQQERERYLAQRERELAEQERRWEDMQLSQRERELIEREHWMAEQQAKREAAARQVSDMIEERNKAEQVIIDAVGPDVWEGYKALRGCQYERAYALADVGYTSRDRYHQLGALWLEAMTAVDSRDTAHADEVFKRIAQKDEEIDTVQQASLAADQAVLDMRAERRDIGIVCP